MTRAAGRRDVALIAMACALASISAGDALATSIRERGLWAEFRAEPAEGPPESCALVLMDDSGSTGEQLQVVLRRGHAQIVPEGIAATEFPDAAGADLYGALTSGERVQVRMPGSAFVHARRAHFRKWSRCRDGPCNAFAECRAAVVCARMLGHELPDAAGACRAQPHECRGLDDAAFDAEERAMLRRAVVFMGGLRAPHSSCFSIGPRPGGRGRLVHVTVPAFVEGGGGGTVEVDADGKPVRAHFAARAGTAATDAPESAARPILDFRPAADHAAALATWNGVADINGWIAAHFQYDRSRALQLSETQRAKSGAAVLAPGEFFSRPRGVCIDLARFAVETLRVVDPSARPAFLMVEFEPVEVAGNTLRLHWLAMFRRGGEYFFFADSKRPGDIAGPYASVDAFIADYELYRGRKVVRWRELESHERKVRYRAARREREGSAPASQ